MLIVSLITLFGISLFPPSAAAAANSSAGTNFTLWNTPASPIPPSQDPFYTAPPGFESSPPGTVFRYRVAPGNLSVSIANYSMAYNILYGTTDSHGNASWAVTTLIAPQMASGPVAPLLSYQYPYASSSVDSSPSYLLYNSEFEPDLLDITAALARGWFVSLPDYEGPSAALGLGMLEGYATLDNVRAVLELARASPDIGLSPEAKYALWGYSGGSLATEHAAELQESYASELDFAGTVLGGVLVDILKTMFLMSASEWAANDVNSLMGSTVQFPAQRAFLVSKLKTSGPSNATTFLGVQNMSFTEAFLTFEDRSISDYFVDGWADVFSPIIQEMYNTQSLMGQHGIPRMPVFVYQAIGDQFCPIAWTDALVEKYCEQGANIRFERNEIGDHLTEYQNGHTRSLNWLENAFNGTHIDIQRSGCKISNVAVIDPFGALL